jgi:hypothetical protein
MNSGVTCVHPVRSSIFATETTVAYWRPVRMRESHHPTIRRLDEWWVVECPECQKVARARYGGREVLPVGIGMPLESRLTAERLKENHARR